ncbi:hypothetical protein RYX36_011833 [Vicia faba]
MGSSSFDREHDIRLDEEIDVRKFDQSRESNLKYYERRYYYDLKDVYYKLQVSDFTFRCLLCSNKDYYSLTNLLRHAKRIADDVHGETERNC